MARFLNTSATNYYLEELIKASCERLIIISLFLKFNDRIRELLEDKDRMKIDVRIVYGKSELAPQEINWLRLLGFVRTSFCQHLHAKCYVSERYAIISSMNLYDFSKINNNEMGVLISRTEEEQLYPETFEEAQRLIRISDEVRLSAETIDKCEDPAKAQSAADKEQGKVYDKLTTSKLAKHLGMRTAELTDELITAGLLVKDGDHFKLTDNGKTVGGEFRFSKKFGPYFIWPPDVVL
jgi:phosphatidylserine/phosphatidylglycerophosphate/cardiolipin synthase-like enzyme